MEQLEKFSKKKFSPGGGCCVLLVRLQLRVITLPSLRFTTTLSSRMTSLFLCFTPPVCFSWYVAPSAAGSDVALPSVPFSALKYEQTHDVCVHILCFPSYSDRAVGLCLRTSFNVHFLLVSQAGMKNNNQKKENTSSGTLQA